ncbi:hypothetical protein B296_00039652 [Ensete ventricosum]|uniref:Uncharacterized protein n=1 Tax=Ensete ventricosum TaxID=4639 RepID=A0A426ZSM1_ENSVE|nr:hypothetical protein B296_00039652 [Ensete ventricosum]
MVWTSSHGKMRQRLFLMLEGKEVPHPHAGDEASPRSRARRRTISLDSGLSAYQYPSRPVQPISNGRNPPLPRHIDRYTPDFDRYRGVPVTPWISIVTEVYRLVRPGIFGLLTPGIFGGSSALFRHIVNTPRRTIPSRV